MLGNNDFDALAAWELVGQDLATKQTLFPSNQARGLASAFGWQANGNGVLAAVARINGTESDRNRWSWTNRSRFAANRSRLAAINTSESGRSGSQGSGNS
jgi:hypothetical protein